MAAAPPFKVYDASGTYQAATKTPSIAKVVARHLGIGATVREGHRVRDTVMVVRHNGRQPRS
jgi:hypothetical protein